MRLKTLAIASCLGLLAVAFLPSSKADEWNKKTILTVNEPLMIPGKVLEPGKYVMKLMDSQSNRHIVQVFNEDESKLQTTILAIPNYRPQPAGDTQFGFWETPAGQPRALRAWFYPGDNFGQQFAYPKEVATQIAKAANQNVPAIVSSGENLGQAEVREITPSGQEEAMNTGEPQGAEKNRTAEAQSNQTQAQTTASSEATTPSTTTTTPENEQVGSTRTGTGQPSEATAQTQAESSAAQPTTPESSAAQSATTPGMTSQSATTTGATAQSQPTTTETQPQPEAGVSGAGQPLPRTASPFPLVGLGGLLSLGAAAAARAVRRNS